MNHPAHIGVIGLYQMDGLTHVTEHHIDTPFGHPSDVFISGELARRSVFLLLARHRRQKVP